MSFSFSSALRRSGSLGLLAGVGLGINVLSPQSASAAINLWYNSIQNPAANLGNTGSLDGSASNFYVKGVITNLNSTDVQIDLTSNFGNADHFIGIGAGAQGTNSGVSFNLTGIANPPALLTCSVGPNIPGAIPSPNGNVCNTDDPALIFNPIGSLNFINSEGWELLVNLPPLPAGSQNTTGSAGELYTFVLRGLQESNFTGNLSPGTGSPYALNSISCIHAQGLSGQPDSTAICSRIADDNVSVPGPLPLLGAAAAFGYSRKIRTRIQSSRQQATIS